MYSITFIFVVLCYNFMPAACSLGDRSHMYRNCVTSCVKGNCTTDGSMFLLESTIKQDYWCKLLRWSCQEECRYACMWQTAKEFQTLEGYMPKFHGKWPFIRTFGMQEPASAVASMLNLITNVHMQGKLFNEFTVKREPLVLFWHGFAAVCINAWLWSAIFHTRDTAFTEFMDYTCALSMVMSLFVAAIIRVFYKRRKITILLLGPPMLFFVAHVHYLYTGKIDYEHNMKVNILFGVVGSLIWLFWSGFQYVAGRRYVWRMIAFIILSGAALTLEVMDFPPKYNWDAHSLWHLSTAPLPLLFYQFVIDDLRWMQAGLEDLDLKMA